jgi:dihydropteroate synthase
MRTPEAEQFIDHYVSILVDVWGIRIDHEDGSTAPFTAIIAELVP